MLNMLILLIPRASDMIAKKWQLASQGNISHIVILPQMTDEKLTLLCKDLLPSKALQAANLLQAHKYARLGHWVLAAGLTLTSGFVIAQLD